MEEYADQAIQAVIDCHAQAAYCKFLSANDTGLTGGHQAGIYVSKPSVSILFDKPCTRGENRDRFVKIKWQDGTETDTRFIYYGVGTRNEYRITNFGRGFPFLRPEYTGALFVLIRYDEEDYKGFFLNSEDDINRFLDSFNLSPTETNRLISISEPPIQTREDLFIENFVGGIKEFPSSEKMAEAARNIHNEVYDHSEYIITNPDRKIVGWTNTEYALFRKLENEIYKDLLTEVFKSVDAFVEQANTVLNRRKSRAGKSLEHHLAAIFDGNEIEYEAQPVTEGRKRPDFLFPSGREYHDLSFPTDRLAFLAAKTTCKDRWRQVLNEADRLRDRPKFLCTLQQGISPVQMDEMQEEKVILVVPQEYISSYPKDRRERIWSILKFVSYIREVEKG